MVVSRSSDVRTRAHRGRARKRPSRRRVANGARDRRAIPAARASHRLDRRSRRNRNRPTQQLRAGGTPLRGPRRSARRLSPRQASSPRAAIRARATPNPTNAGPRSAFPLLAGIVMIEQPIEQPSPENSITWASGPTGWPAADKTSTHTAGHARQPSPPSIRIQAASPLSSLRTASTSRHAIVSESVAVRQPLHLHARQHVLAELDRASKRRRPQSEVRAKARCRLGRN
jgi:hypothetical protein